MRKQINRYAFLWMFLLQSLVILAQDSKIFSTVQEVLEFSKRENYTFKNADIQLQLADLTKKTAIGNVINPKIPAMAQSLNNINQQLSFLPGQVFGLPQGTFKEVVIGQQFVSTFTVSPQFDILNLANYAQIKVADINQQLVVNQNKLNEQALYEKIAMVYFNILSFKEQKQILEENIISAQGILEIVSNKFAEGISRKQDVNEAEVNLISLQDKLQQIEINLKIQYQIFSLFFENRIAPVLAQSIWNFEEIIPIIASHNNLLLENAKLQSQFAMQEYKSIKYQNIPVLSFVSAFNLQNSSNDNFFSDKSIWIRYNYIGLKLSYDFPTTVQKYSALKSKENQIELLKNNEEHSKKENDNRNAQLILEYEKAAKQRDNFKKIYSLKKDTYNKNLNQFKEDVLPLDKLLISQNDMLISKLNVVSALANIGFNRTKIEINNEF